MAAGVSAVQYSRMPGDKKLLPTQKVGTEFLDSSHFTISQDDGVTQRSLKSIFKKDYVAHDIYGKPPGSKPPPPANFLHRDDRFFNIKASETAKEYEYRHLDKPPLVNADANLGRTNFKMDRDLSKFDSFHTTHSQHYRPKELSTFPRGKLPENPMQSYIPQGDREKAPLPLSDYRDRYRGHDALTTKPDKAKSMDLGPATIKGDGRLQHFSTTHNSTYKGVDLPRLHPFPAPVGTNIPQGDRMKETTKLTTQQVSFPQHDFNGSGYDKEATMGKLQGTNFRQDDGHGKWNDYRTTMAQSYLPVNGEMRTKAVGKHRNHSDFPEGDENPYRNAARANLTTNRHYHGDPPDMERPNIVSGANKRTKSNVWFGEPRLAEEYYDTTCDSTFTSKSVPYSYNRPHLNTKSSVPMDYWAGERTNPTTWSDFQDPKIGKMIPNPTAIDNLKESHIRAPLGGDRQFSTEHLDKYTPKSIHRGPKYDAGRLQRSSVPLGTLLK